MSDVSLEHPDLGRFDGLQGNEVQQFLGIQYATLENRLAEPQVRTAYDTPVDATNYGPAAHQPPSGFDNEVNLFIQQSLPKPDLTYSDVDCLNLNIIIPTPKQGQPVSRRKLPVFVWIHGGGFVLGANSWPQYDHAKLVNLASERNVPVIGVGINFRLGLPALLTSEELRSAGYKSNNLLRDQRAAFTWIRKFISGFGGDPDNITAIGESSGAMAVTLHLCSPVPLFHRAIATGGTFLLRKPLPPQVHEGIYQQAINALGIDKLSPEQRIEALLTRPMDEIIATLPPSVAFNALVDRELISSGVSYASVASSDVESILAKKWLQALMVGDCQFDASVLTILLGHLKSHASNGFTGAARKFLPPKTADKILAMYDFPSAKTDEEAFACVINYINDIGYYLSTLAFAEGFSRPNTSGKGSSMFFFNHGNPWPGPFQGKASHVLDVAFLFQNCSHVLTDQQRKGAEDFAIDMMRFVSGEEVLGSSHEKDQAGLAMVYGDEGVKIAHARDGKESGRNVNLLSIAREVGGDKLMEVFEKFMMGGG